MGGTPSGPAAELDFSFFKMFLTTVGLILTSSIPSFLFCSRDGKLGEKPLSLVKVDSKYEFKRLALSISLVMRLSLSSLSGATPD